MRKYKKNPMMSQRKKVEIIFLDIKKSDYLRDSRLLLF